MATTITREMFKDKAKPRYEEIEVEGWGVLGIRSASELKRSHRASQLFDDNGKLIPEQESLRRVYAIIDHAMVDEKTPLFTDKDVEWLKELDGDRLDPLMSAIRKFNGGSVGNDPESSESNTS